MSEPDKPTPQEIDRASNAVQDRANRFIHSLNTKGVSCDISVYSNSEVKCPTTVSGFKEANVGDAIIDLLK
jgi:hypothetical protein